MRSATGQDGGVSTTRCNNTVWVGGPQDWRGEGGVTVADASRWRMVRWDPNDPDEPGDWHLQRQKGNWIGPALALWDDEVADAVRAILAALPPAERLAVIRHAAREAGLLVEEE